MEMTKTTHPDIRYWPHYDLVRSEGIGRPGAIVAHVYDREGAEALVQELNQIELTGEGGHWTVRHNRGSMAAMTRAAR